MSVPYVGRPAGSSRSVSPRIQQQFAELQEDYEDRRNSSRVRYDPGLIGSGESFLDEVTPLDQDPQYRKEVFSEMSEALRANLNETRREPAERRTFVEPSRRPVVQAPVRPGPSPYGHPRAHSLQSYLDPYDEADRDDEEYDDGQYDEGYEDDDDDDPDAYEPNPRPRSQRQASPRDPYEELEPVSEYRSNDRGHARTTMPARSRTSNSYSGREHEEPRRSRYRQSEYESDADRRLRDRRDDRVAATRGYPSQQRDRRSAPVRAYPEKDRGNQRIANRRDQQRTRSQPVQNHRSERRSNYTGVQPTRPKFLGPDGRVTTNPCGQPLYVDLGTGPIIATCQEERRGDAPPWHHNMPHIARIADPTMNAENACFVWYYNSEAPR